MMNFVEVICFSYYCIPAYVEKIAYLRGQKLADQRNLSSQLRDQMTKLTQHQQSCETEIVRCRNDMQV